MRTTLDLPDEVFRKLKMLAAQRGMTLKQLLRSVVTRELEASKVGGVQRRLRFPLLDSKAPGRLRLTNAEIDRLLS